MKNWVKCGVFLAGLVCALTAKADEATPIMDRNALEKQYIKCIKNEVKNNCIVSLFQKHRGPNMKKEFVDELNAFLQNILRQTGVYGISVLNKTIKGELYDDRMYLIEKGNGNVGGLRVVFKKTLGKWYLANVQFTDDEQDMKEIMNLKWKL